MFGSEKSQLDALKPDILKVSILGKEAIHVGFHLIPYMVKTILTELPSTTFRRSPRNFTLNPAN
jgi:hypothetical protein